MGNQASLARPPIQCDAECEREKRIIELKSAYQTATKDETKDTDEVRLARKQYYTYTYGQNAFDGLEEKALGKVADANIKKTGFTNFSKMMPNLHDHVRTRRYIG